MEKLVYGKNGQIRFNNVEEKREAFDYILNSNNVEFNIHENNQEQGAWAPEDRIHFRDEDGIPECLKRQMTAGRPGYNISADHVRVAVRISPSGRAYVKTLHILSTYNAENYIEHGTLKKLDN